MIVHIFLIMHKTTKKKTKQNNPLTCFIFRMKSVIKNQKRAATTQVQVRVGISRNELSGAPAHINTPSSLMLLKSQGIYSLLYIKILSSGG